MSSAVGPAAAIGSMSPDLADLVATVLTIYIYDSASEAGNHVHSLAWMLVGWAATDALAADGTLSPAPGAEVATGRSFRTGRSARRALGLTLDEVEATYKRLQRTAGVRRRVEDETLAAFIPRDLWPVVGRIITDGPALSRVRAENFLEDYSDTELDEDRSKQAGAPGLAAIKAFAAAFKRVVTILGRLSGDGHPSENVKQWSLAHRDNDLVLPDARESVRNVPAVPGHIVRRAFQQLCDEIARKLGVAPGDFAAEQRAIEQMSVTKLRRSAIGRALYRRQALMVFCVLGARTSATAALRQSDLIPDWSLSDGRRTPAVRVFEGKRTHRSLPVYKPVPPEFALALQTQAVFMRRWVTEVKRNPAPDPAPLIANTAGRHSSGNDLSKLMGGRGGAGHGSVATLPREGSDPNVGYSAHTCRSRARQWVDCHEGRLWLHDRSVDRPADWIAEALLGHSSRDLRKLYGGGTKTSEVESLVWYATQLTWLMLTTDLGARRRLPLEAYRGGLRDLRRLEAEGPRLSRRLEDVERERATLVGRLNNLGDDAPVSTFRRAFGLYATIDDQRAEVRGDLQRIRYELVRLEADQARLRSSREARELVPDDVPTADLEPFDPTAFDRIDAEGRPGREATGLAELPRLRDFISTSELADLVGMSRDTLSGYLRLGFPSRMRSEPLWFAEPSPLTLSSTPKRQALRVEALNMTHPTLALATTQAALMRLLALSKPRGW